MWGREWFDNASVEGIPRGEDEDEGVEEWVAQLRLMFSYRGQRLAFVRWYEMAQQVQNDTESDVLAEAGCKPLQWYTVRDDSASSYDVIHLESILRREYVVPQFTSSGKKDGSFHLSIFKFSRGVPTKDAIPQH
jgi:hypothetical protein